MKPTREERMYVISEIITNLDLISDGWPPDGNWGPEDDEYAEEQGFRAQALRTALEMERAILENRWQRLLRNKRKELFH